MASSSNSIITVDCERRLIVEGRSISGIVHLNVPLALEKDVEEVRICFRGEMHTWATVNSGQSSSKVHGREFILDIPAVLWRSNSDSPSLGVPDASGMLALPFSFDIPLNDTASFPPSFHCGSLRNGGRVQYYIKAEAARKSWYQRNTRINLSFPFLPLDRTFNRNIITALSNWTGNWKTLEKMENVKPNIINIFGSSGSMEFKMSLPDIPTIPLFQPIPIQLHLRCISKPLPSSSSLDSSSFEFPRIPPLSDIEIRLVQCSDIYARRQHRKMTENVCTFSLKNTAEPQVTAPVWLPDYNKPDKGTWSESAVYTSALVFNSSTPFQSRLIQTYLELHMKAKLPGLGNDVKLKLRGLNLTSGIGPRGGDDLGPLAAFPTLDMPPAYWDVVEIDEKAELNEKA